MQSFNNVEELWWLFKDLLATFPLPEGFKGNISLFPTKLSDAQAFGFEDQFNIKKFVSLQVWYTTSTGTVESYLFHIDEDEDFSDTLFAEMREHLDKHIANG